MRCRPNQSARYLPARAQPAHGISDGLRQCLISGRERRPTVEKGAISECSGIVVVRRNGHPLPRVLEGVVMCNNACRILANQTPWALLVTFALVAPTASYADEPVPAKSPISELRAQFLSAATGRDKGIAAGRLLRSRSAQEVQNLCFDDNAPVALCAAWRRLEV